MTERAPDIPPSRIASDDTPVRYKSARQGARGLAVQALYSWLLTKNDIETVRIEAERSPEFRSVDKDLFRQAYASVIQHQPELEGLLLPHLDRDWAEISPIERAILCLGAWELRDRLDVPYKVVMNEAIELTKRFGGTDAHKYVNGVLDRLVPELRVAEWTESLKNKNAN
jgi:transcription antitermination protein NusB